MNRSRLLAAPAAAGLALALVLLTGASAGAADPTKAPGGNFDLSVWQLQEPVGSPGSPTTIPSSRLQGAGGYQDAYFYTDTRDGAMTFWAPEKGVTTP
ncbi:polysaccharide lyase family 7 protein, partial [Streptomyces sp. NPDC048279]|uniref:polysaccharide lyase family 7 protein n=1 Tax=Streptomyces sp. NPDC048279 TaxID=3154714 RepID=UPI003419F7D1